MKRFLMIAMAMTLISGSALGNVFITEISSKAALDQEDYFELTNFGNTAVDISGWKYDDESMDLGDAVPFNLVTSIAPGETIVIFQLDETDPLDPTYDPAGELANFRAAWGLGNDIQVGWHNGAGMGKGDAATIFDENDAIVTQLAYGDGDLTDPLGMIPDTHAGEWAGGREVDSAVWVPGTDPATYTASMPGLYGGYTNSVGDYGSPGVLPEPTTIALLLVGAAAVIRRR